ncbi:hypothetical protein Gotur_031501 [Gossypium turneri]
MDSEFNWLLLQEEDGGLVVGANEGQEDIDYDLCLVGRFVRGRMVRDLPLGLAWKMLTKSTRNVMGQFIEYDANLPQINVVD